jgi:tRNA A-37 threonylcarbamoyl transferase component Bud32
MDLRRLARGTVEWDRLEAVAREIADRYGRESVRVAFLDADNWLSTPMVVDDEWFVKVVTQQNSLVHALFTGARNLGAVTAGTENFFEHFETPLEMAEHDLAATARMREVGVDAPSPVEAFEVDGLGVLVLEYLPDSRPLDELDDAAVTEHVPAVFAALATVHENGLAHGDLQRENVLVQDGRPHFIDATKVSARGLDAARSYDLACALAAFAPRIGASDVVAAALEQYSAEDIVAARDFLDVVALRPDHTFDVQLVKGEIEAAAA